MRRGGPLPSIGLRFRRNSGGHPAIPRIGFSESDNADAIVWKDWFLDVAQTEATTGQGGQTCDGSGTCSTPDGYVFTAGEPNALTYNIRKYTLAGAASTIIARNSIIYGLSIDSAGNIYSGGVGTATGGNGGLRKYTGSSLQWDKDHGGTIYAVAANASDVCIGGAPATLTDSKTTRKYTSSGTLSWSADHGNYVQAVAIDASGNVYSGGVVSSSVTTRKYNSGGTEQWNANHGATVRGIVVDSAGNVFTCGNNTGSYSIRKYNSSGSLVWSANSGDNDYGIALDASGNVYVCGIGYIRKFDSSGAEVTSGGFPITGLGSLHSIAITSYGGIFVCGESYNSATLWLYSPSGVLQWSADHGYTCYSVGLYEPPAALSIPSLPLSIALGIPTIISDSNQSGLSLRLALGIPTVTDTVLPPDVVVLALQSVYRLYVSGGDLLELPFARLQCQRRLGESTWITAIVPTCSTTLLADLAARKAADGRIIVYSGVRLSDGTEQTGQFLQAVLTEIEGERTGRLGTIRLQGRLVPTYFTAQSRTLYGISQRGKADDGTYWAKCAADPLLHPNDTVNDGAQSWTVKSILYEIAPRQNSMSLTST